MSGKGAQYALGVIFPCDSENVIEKIVTRVFSLENRYFREQNHDFRRKSRIFSMFDLWNGMVHAISEWISAVKPKAKS